MPTTIRDLPEHSRPGADWTINEVLRRLPASAAVFNEFGVDSCCGGSLRVADSACARGRSLDELLAALRALTVA